MEDDLKSILLADNVLAADLTLIYDDAHGLWGGTTITVGDGIMERRTYPTGSREPDILKRKLEGWEIQDLVRLLIELKAWAQETPDRSSLPDESRARLSLRINNRASDIWERFNEMPANGRLIQIKARLERLTAGE
jgi:hypothetical protein